MTNHHLDPHQPLEVKKGLSKRVSQQAFPSVRQESGYDLHKKQGDFSTGPSLFSVHNQSEKMPTSQPELLFQEILLLRDPLVVSLAFSFWY